MIPRASTIEGTPPSIAAMIKVSAFVSWSWPIVMSLAIVRAEGTRARLSMSVLSAWRRRVAHSATTRAAPPNPCSFSLRHRAAALCPPEHHCKSSQGKCASSEFWRTRNTSPRWPRMTCRTRARLCPVLRTICLIETPARDRARIAVLVSSRPRLDFPVFLPENHHGDAGTFSTRTPTPPNRARRAVSGPVPLRPGQTAGAPERLGGVVRQWPFQPGRRRRPFQAVLDCAARAPQKSPDLARAHPSW